MLAVTSCQQTQVDQASEREDIIAGAIMAFFALILGLLALRQCHILNQKNRLLEQQLAEAATLIEELKVKNEKLKETNGASRFTRHESMEDGDGPLANDVLRRDELENRVGATGQEPRANSHHSTADAQHGKRKTGGSSVVSQAVMPLDVLPSDELFQHIRQVIVAEKLYLNPGFDRQAAVNHFHITKERVGEAFAQGSEHAKITDFINLLRLDHARYLITSHPEMSIDEVSSASGFAVRRTFTRLFKEKYDLTPTEYRNLFRSNTEGND